MGKENPLHELTVINQKLFDEQAQPDDAIEFSEQYMQALDSGFIESTDLNEYYHPLLTYIDKCLRMIHDKLQRDNTLTEISGDDAEIMTTGSNQFAGNRIHSFLI